MQVICITGLKFCFAYNRLSIKIIIRKIIAMRKVITKIDIRASAEKIMSAFTDPDMLKGWWGVERSLIDLRPGGLYSLAWNISETGFGYISTGIIKEYQFDQKLVIENFAYFNPQKPILGPMSLAISIKSNGDLTELSICQEGYQEGPDWDWYYQAVLDAWPKALQIVKDYLE